MDETDSLSDPGLKDHDSLLPVFESDADSADNDIADGLIAEMTCMNNEDLESLLMGSPLDEAMQASSTLSTLIADCDQTMTPSESEFGTSVSTSPALSPSPLSYSPSSESGIEDDDSWYDESTCTPVSMMDSQISMVRQLLKNNIPNHCAPKVENLEASTIHKACEELKKLITTVASVQMPTSTCVTSHCTTPITAFSQVPMLLTQFPTTTGLASTADPTQGESRNQLLVPCTNDIEGAEPKLVLLEEPEENYRARYESEGCRGPIHGSSDNTFPTIKVDGYFGSVWITVHLVTSSGQPHYHSIHGPGSTKVPCKEFLLPGGIPAVQVLVEQDCDMTAILDSLSIRRLRNWEGDKQLRKRGIDPRTWKKERKEAMLLFQADIPARDGQPELKLSCKSRIFQCSSSGATGSPEIWWSSRTEGSVEGGDELGLIGKKFPSGFKVRFSTDLPSGKVWEVLVESDKGKSHQGAGVVITPSYFDLNIFSPVTVNVEVLSGTSKSAKCSEPVEFTYRPRVDNTTFQNVTACMSTPGQDTLDQGGFVTGLQGGTTIATLPTCSALVNASLLTPEPSLVLPATSQQNDETDWHRIIVQVKELQQRGELSAHHIKDLIKCIHNKDLVLLQAFRSAKTAGTHEECQMKFKQYLSPLIGSM